MTWVGKYLRLVFLFVITTSWQTPQKNSSIEFLEKNFETLQIETLQELVRSFSLTLEHYYVSKNENNQLIDSFLMDVVNDQIDLSKLIDKLSTEKIHVDLLESGLMNELYLSIGKNQSVTDEIIEIQQGNNVNENSVTEPTFQFNMYGRFMNAMTEAAKSDQLVNDYVNAKLVSEMIPAKQLAKGLLYSMEHNETNDYILMSILVVEFYVPLLLKTQYQFE